MRGERGGGGRGEGGRENKRKRCAQFPCYSLPFSACLLWFVVSDIRYNIIITNNY